MHKTVDVYELRSKKTKPENKNLKYFTLDQDSKTIARALVLHFKHLNFAAMIQLLKGRAIFDRYILLHSEKNSSDVGKFLSTAEPVYYWCHGIIARDWYRFAEHDPRLNCPPVHEKTFLVYCRAWTGTREYRLKFLDLLVEHNLLEHCKTSVLHHDQEFDLGSYVCTNAEFQPINHKHLQSLSNNVYSSSASADYCVEDFVSTDISVVLETIAADTKIHLTEKTLRPIACGHPFMLVAGPGSLDYLRSYGFKTFSPWIDESYDLETDIATRMKLITKEMQRIENFLPLQKQNFLTQIQSIAAYNKNHFFSNEFFNKIHNELVDNLNLAITRVKATRGQHYLAKKAIIKKFRPTHQPPLRKNKELALAKVLRQLRQDPTISLKSLINQYPNGFFNS